MAADSSIQAVRARALSHLCLQRGDAVVDLGCGPGTFTVQLAALVGGSGRVLGVDQDWRMVGAADHLAADAGVSDRVVHQIDDCTNLTIASGLFDACYCERVLQHLDASGPALAVAEAVRILKIGGRLVMVDSDWSTLVINSDRQALERRVAADHLRRLPNPTSGRRLRALVAAAGIADAQEESWVLNISAGGGTAAWLTENDVNTLSGAELREWRESLARARDAALPYGHLTMTMVTGIKRPG